ncbi:MAG: SCP2 sterol-binding domain-containing protein [Candidatus Bathyarchaeia archaeon]
MLGIDLKMIVMTVYEEARSLFEGKKDFIRRDIEGVDRVFQFIFTDKPEENYYIEFSKGDVIVGKGIHSSPHVRFSMKTDTYRRITSGELDGEQAYMLGLISIDGSIYDAARFGYILQKLLRR